MDGRDRISGAELIPDLGVLIASLFLPRFFRGYANTPQYKEVAKTLTEQFMPHKSGHGFQEEILLAEVVMLLESKTKAKFEKILITVSKGEKQFLAGAIALFAAKYQKEMKQTLKSPGEKDIAQIVSSLEPLTKDNPAIKFLEEILNHEDRSVEETIALLRSKNMIKESVAGKIRLMFDNYKHEHGSDSRDEIQMLLGFIEKLSSRPKQKVSPLGLVFACLMGRSDKVELMGMETFRNWKERKKSWKQS